MVTTRSQTAASATSSFPLKEYFSSLSYLTLLLAGTIAVLPRSTAWFYDTSNLQQTTSADRPESPLLTPLTANPAGTAAWMLVGLAIVMGWWGNKMRRWAGATASQGERMKSATLATLGTALLLLVLATLLGAPLRLWPRTLLFALNLALLTAYPTVAALGVPGLYETGVAARYRLTRLVCEWRTESALERAIVYPMAGALVGAWVGAVPLPLDWDRPWQGWPLTALAASVLGFALGSWASWGVSALESLQKEIAEDKAANAPKAPVQRKKKGRKSAQ